MSKIVFIFKEKWKIRWFSSHGGARFLKRDKLCQLAKIRDFGFCEE